MSSSERDFAGNEGIIGEKLFPSELLEAVARIQDDIGISHFPISKPHEFDRYVDLVKVAKHVMSLEGEIQTRKKVEFEMV